MSVRWWRHCILCGEAYDIGTNYEICPECRMQEYKKEDEDEIRRSL